MTVNLNQSAINVLKYLRRERTRCGQYVLVSDDEDGDGLTFGGKQHLHVENYILLGSVLREPSLR